MSQALPTYHSSLPYSLVRDFAYPPTYPLHYGPQPDASGLLTPASERSRRLSDPEVTGWEDTRAFWAATTSWTADKDSTYTAGSHAPLPAVSYHGGGPPYSEDEDLQSPIVMSSRHKKKRSENDRGRSPGDVRALNESEMEQYTPLDEIGDIDGPGGEVETLSVQTRQPRQPRHRDSNFAKPLERSRSPYGDPRDMVDEEDDQEEPDHDRDETMDDEDDGRYSKDYEFTIVSPDEEMHGKAIALFDFLPEHENELGLREGQIILVSYRHDQGWLVAEDPATKEVGLVPEDFVRLVRHIEGGLNGLREIGIETPEEEDVMETTHDSLATPIAATREDSPTAQTPQLSQGESSKLAVPGDSYPAVQSSFSTSSKDFNPGRSKGTETT